MPGPRRRQVRSSRALAVLAAAAVLLPASGAVAQPSSSEIERDLRTAEAEAGELGTELAEVRDLRAEAEERLALITARLEEARAELVAAEGQVALAELALEEAEQAQASAEAAHRRAVGLLERAEARLADEEALLTSHVVRTFKYGTVGATRGAMVLEVLRRAEDPNAFAVGMKQLQVVLADQDATVTRVFELREERSRLADDAARAYSRAVQAAYDAAQTLAVVEELREEAAALAAEVAQQEEEQRVVLASLQATEEETAALLGRVESRVRTLRVELAAQRERELEAARRAAGGGTGRLALPGAAGGPDVPGGILCPVVGAVAGRDFTNDWGYPRSGGRTHQGNDIFAPRGTPVVAVADGVVVSWNPPSRPTALGGITVTYRTADASEWYNAHLDAIADGIAPGVAVRAGQTIGTVGNTGNARTTPPHLHLGRRYAGGWVNPWPTTSPVCR